VATAEGIKKGFPRQQQGARTARTAPTKQGPIYFVRKIVSADGCHVDHGSRLVGRRRPREHLVFHGLGQLSEGRAHFLVLRLVQGEHAESFSPNVHLLQKSNTAGNS